MPRVKAPTILTLTQYDIDGGQHGDEAGYYIRRARFRNGQFQEELLKPKELIEIPFEFNWTARRIPADARLRLTIAPLNSPNYQKNFNSGGRIGFEKLNDAQIANIKIFHDAKRASRLTLPLAAPVTDITAE